MQTTRLYIRVRGRVQGVGYRYFARRMAQSLGLSGWVRNLDDGSVEAEAQGPETALASFIEHLRRGPSGANVRELESHELPPSEGESGFSIRF